MSANIEVPVVGISDLTKKFGRQHALDGLNMTVDRGEVHAFLGPNGAGKSTTIRILLGLLRATSGSIRVLGSDPWKDAVSLHRRLAYVPGDVNLWPNLTGGEAIDLMHRTRGGVDRARRDELVERFELDPTKRGRSYSKGNRQKVALIAALASDVELYVFDEPTSGLDPLMERVFQECVAELRTAGRTVLLSSHILEQVDRLCDTVTIIRDGVAVQQGRIEDLRHLHRLRVVATLPPGSSPASLDTHEGVHDLTSEGSRVAFALDREHLADVLGELSRLGVTELQSEPMSLEELFLNEYARSAK